jgi:hypothetical protein
MKHNRKETEETEMAFYKPFKDTLKTLIVPPTAHSPTLLQAKRFTYNVTLGRVRATNVAVEKQ